MMNRKYYKTLAFLAVIIGVVTSNANARETFDVGDGELGIEGFLRSEVRARISGDESLTQWVNRFQLEAELSFEDKGLFDEISFVTVLRPEYDVAQYHNIARGRTGRGADRPSNLGIPFTVENDPIGYAGFGAGLSTGGLSKNIEQGLWDASRLSEFEVIAHNTPFPLLSPLSDRNLNCKDCVDVDDSHRNVAMGKTGTSGDLYPFRELYVDAVIDNLWLRLGKQQIVWGKTDFFRMQDLVNPIDFGQHFFFDQFEDIRVPQWIASAQYKAGSIGPLDDTALQFVWNFDKFKRVGLGAPYHAWAHPFGKEVGTFAAFNTYFSPEPCVSAETAAAAGASAETVCQAGDGRLASGFGIPVGLSKEEMPSHRISNTEFGARFEFRIKDVRLALSHYYGWTDTPLIGFASVNVNAAAVPGVVANDALIVGLTEGIEVPVAVMNPEQAIRDSAAAGYAPAIEALQRDNARLFYDDLDVFGGLTNLVYDQAHTTGISADYFDDWSGIVFRLESSYTFDELVNNTRKADWVDHSDVARFSIGLDRPTFLRWLNKNRTFFLSFQLFDTWYLDHEGSNNDGYFVDEHNLIYTFYFETHYLRDTLKPSGFLVYEDSSESWVGGLNLTWFASNHWSIKGGIHSIWGGDDHISHDVGPFSSFTLDGNYDQEAIFGFGRQGIGAMKKNDEVFMQIQYQF